MAYLECEKAAILFLVKASTISGNKGCAKIFLSKLSVETNIILLLF